MPNFSDRDLNDLLRVIDTNGNGVVEYEELLGDLGETDVVTCPVKRNTWQKNLSSLTYRSHHLIDNDKSFLATATLNNSTRKP